MDLETSDTVIVIVDYQMGNVGSVANMLCKLGAQCAISSDKDVIAGAEKLVLPGVGAFDTGVEHLRELDLLDVLNDKVIARRTPVLGICLGMQLLTKRSEEGGLPGLGWIDGETVRFQFDAALRHLKIPHMGWNSVQPLHQGLAIFVGIPEHAYFYFAHSYYVEPQNQEGVAAVTEYGSPYCSVIVTDQVWGTQFHPEKSGTAGLQLLRNFVKWVEGK